MGDRPTDIMDQRLSLNNTNYSTLISYQGILEDKKYFWFVICTDCACAFARREAMAGHVKDKDTLIPYIRPQSTTLTLCGREERG